MQALKLKGTIDETGRLILAEPVGLMPGEVEIIILKPAETEILTEIDSTAPARGAARPTGEYKIKALAHWFENLPPIDPNFDADEAKWQHLKDKHNL